MTRGNWDGRIGLGEKVCALLFLSMVVGAFAIVAGMGWLVVMVLQLSGLPWMLAVLVMIALLFGGGAFLMRCAGLRLPKEPDHYWSPKPEK